MIKSFELYKEVAEKGHTNVLYDIGYCYERRIVTGINEARTFKFYKKAV